MLRSQRLEFNSHPAHEFSIRAVCRLCQRPSANDLTGRRIHCQEPWFALALCSDCQQLASAADIAIQRETIPRQPLCDLDAVDLKAFRAQLQRFGRGNGFAGIGFRQLGVCGATLFKPTGSREDRDDACC
jgi:hypothetical protein